MSLSTAISVVSPLIQLTGTITTYSLSDRQEGGPLNQELLGKIANLYAKVFAGPPWFEAKKCGLCPNQPFFKEGTVCPKCRQTLRPAYPQDEVIQDIEAALRKNGCLSVFENSNGTPVGAAWGFESNVEDLQGRYESPEMKGRVAESVRPFIRAGRIFYYAEAFVDPDFQGRKIGKQLSEVIVNQARTRQLNIAVRTLTTSPMAIIARNLGMDAIIEPGADSDYKNKNETNKGERMLLAKTV